MPAGVAAAPAGLLVMLAPRLAFFQPLAARGQPLLLLLPLLSLLASQIRMLRFCCRFTAVHDTPFGCLLCQGFTVLGVGLSLPRRARQGSGPLYIVNKQSSSHVTKPGHPKCRPTRIDTYKGIGCTTCASNTSPWAFSFSPRPPDLDPRLSISPLFIVRTGQDGKH